MAASRTADCGRASDGEGDLRAVREVPAPMEGHTEMRSRSRRRGATGGRVLSGGPGGGGRLIAQVLLRDLRMMARTRARTEERREAEAVKVAEQRTKQVVEAGRPDLTKDIKNVIHR